MIGIGLGMDVRRPERLFVENEAVRPELPTVGLLCKLLSPETGQKVCSVRRRL